MSLQETFDRVCRHLMAQGRRSTRSLGGNEEACAYKSVDGCKCAVGCLIPDSKYSLNTEFQGISRLMIDGVLEGVPRGDYLKAELGGEVNRHYDLLMELQSEHDASENWRTPAVLQDALRSVAIKHRLDPSVLSTAPFASPWPATGLIYRGA